MTIQWKCKIDLRELDLIDRVPDKLWMEILDIVQETGIKTIPMENIILSTEFKLHYLLCNHQFQV